MNYIEHDNLIAILSPDDTFSKPASARFSDALICSVTSYYNN
jgi:hypothetical protein